MFDRGGLPVVTCVGRVPVWAAKTVLNNARLANTKKIRLYVEPQVVLEAVEGTNR